jgi:sulfoxide reductase catalytic subunit YedY
MLIRVPRPWQPGEAAVTDEAVYRDRRRFIRTGTWALAGAALAPSLAAAKPADQLQSLRPLQPSEFSTDEALNSYEQITRYNNFYEFGAGKGDPSALAPELLRTEPWTVEVGGEAEVTGTFDFEDVIRRAALEERIYRLRCVEAWSMVVPWVGVPLADVLKRFRPTSRAKFVRFETLLDPEQMPAQRADGFSWLASIDWPYVEGLRMDEAMNPLSLLSVGLYGKEMPAQNGAPIRLVVPWKYGFKSIKSIVRIEFVEQQPINTWNKIQPNEYGFYANVNPNVDHPRWDQSRERRIGEFFKRETLMFNGYAEEVAHLYKGMDLARYY